MKKFKATIEVSLEYEIEAESEDKAWAETENIELPKEYVEDSFSVLSIKEKK